MVDVKVLKEGDISILDVIGEVDASSSIELDNALRETLDGGALKIIVDLTNLEYISSAGLGVFMSYVEDINEKNAQMILTGLNEKVKNVFEILGLDQLLETAETRSEGVEKLK